MKRLCWLFCECLITISLLMSPKSGSCSETTFTYLIWLSYKTNEKSPFCGESCKTKLELKHRNPRFHSTLKRFDVSGWFRASLQSPWLILQFWLWLCWQKTVTWHFQPSRWNEIHCSANSQRLRSASNNKTVKMVSVAVCFIILLIV